MHNQWMMVYQMNESGGNLIGHHGHGKQSSLSKAYNLSSTNVLIQLTNPISLSGLI